VGPTEDHCLEHHVVPRISYPALHRIGPGFLCWRMLRPWLNQPQKPIISSESSSSDASRRTNRRRWSMVKSA